MEKSSIAIITARGGSKRIPRKNIKEFLGEPIICYSIKAALESNCFEVVMVSTDDEEIANISINHGAEVPFMRSSETSGDYATTEDVIKEVITEYKKRGRTFDSICCIYPTAPFVTGERLRESMDLLWSSNIDSLIPVVKFSYPPQRSFVIQNNKLFIKYAEHLTTRSQDLESLYHDCGQYYCIKTQSFLEHNEILTTNTVPFVLTAMEVQDIDTEEDWKLAEMKYRMLYGE